MILSPKPKRRGVIHLVAILPLIVALINLAAHGHVAPNIHAFRMARYQSGKFVVAPRLLLNSHQRMLDRQAAKMPPVIIVPVPMSAPPAPLPMPKAAPAYPKAETPAKEETFAERLARIDQRLAERFEQPAVVATAK